MPEQKPQPKLSEHFQSKQRALTRMKAIALVAVILAACLWVFARSMGAQHPEQAYWGYIESFAEAAMIGGFADWFAVVALFKHPMGIPLWHTAIITRRKSELAKSLGSFVQEHLLTDKQIEQQLQTLQPVHQIGHWLSNGQNANNLSRHLSQALVQWLTSTAGKQQSQVIAHKLTQLIHNRIRTLQWTDITQELSTNLMQSGAHHLILNGLLNTGSAHLKDPQHQQKLTQWLLEQINTDNAMIKMAILGFAPKLLDNLSATLQDIQQTEQLPLRDTFELWTTTWLTEQFERETTNERIQAWIDQNFNQNNLQRWLAWDETTQTLIQNLADDQSTLRDEIAKTLQSAGQFFLETGSSLDDHSPSLHNSLNDKLTLALKSIVIKNRTKIAPYIQNQIEQWSAQEVSQSVELAIGRDLQFIRLNGTLVGGLIGLVLHAITQWI